MKFLYLVALGGLIASVMVNITTWFDINLQAKLPYVWLLHGLVFAVWFPMIICLRDPFYADGTDHPRQDSRALFWKNATSHAPQWMKVFVLAVVAYSLAGFVMGNHILEGGSASIVDGVRVLSDREGIIRELSDTDFEVYKAISLRMFSGIWMAAFAVSLILLSSRIHGPSEADL